MLTEAPPVKFNRIISFYNERHKNYGHTSKGLGWSNQEQQVKRFEVFLQMLPIGEYSLHDYGCGYGALLDFLGLHGRLPVAYYGTDICAKQVFRAKETLNKHGCEGNIFSTHFIMIPADFFIISGTFNVMIGNNLSTWEKYIEIMLSTINLCSHKGFGFNILTGKVEHGLYASEPKRWTDFCSQFGKCEVISGYLPGDFTILIRKEVNVQ